MAENAIRRRRAHVKDRAARDLAKHVLTLQSESVDGKLRHWRAMSPTSSNYWFEIIEMPNTLMINGDMGLLLLMRDPDMIKWAKKCRDDADYFFGKVHRDIKTEEYDEEVLIESMIDYWGTDGVDGMSYEDFLELQGEVRSANDQHEACRVIGESSLFDGGDFPSYLNRTQSALWLREALYWAIDRMDSVLTDIRMAQLR